VTEIPGWCSEGRPERKASVYGASIGYKDLERFAGCMSQADGDSIRFLVLPRWNHPDV